jgi:hypothetical protein
MQNETTFAISLDLGSDSTVAYVSVEGRPDYEQIDLQYYARALAPFPRILEERGIRLSRLKSRYGVNEQFETSETLYGKERIDSLMGFKERLPAAHATRPLVDFERYWLEDRILGANLVHCGEPAGCLFKFFDDATVPFPLESLLPNAKLVFQASIGKGRNFKARIAGTDTIESFALEPVELIKNQICLILENFVRNNPLLVEANQGTPPTWQQCTVVLTVPNTYSPMHCALLKRAVSETLECSVETITESDAIAFFFLVTHRPDAGLEPGQTAAASHQYLTIDIGKGTTDLTLMDVSYRRPMNQPDAPFRQHVYALARAGRPSGGAKATFLIAEFFEKLIDLTIAREVPELTAGSPFRLTTRTSLYQPIQQSGRDAAMLAFETLCDRYKRSLAIGKRGVILQDLGESDEASRIGSFLSAEVVNAIDPFRDRDATERDRVEESVRVVVRAVLETPTKFGGTAVDQKDPSWHFRPAWDELRHAIEAYVDENVDTLLIELARAHLDGNDHLPLDTGLDAILALMEPRMKLHDNEVRTASRTHVVIAGQASQFQPLRSRLEELFKQARIEKMPTRPGKQAAAFQPVASKGRLKALLESIAPARQESGPDPQRSYWVDLKSENLKDGCAYGALAWLVNQPVMANPDEIHGQLAIERQSGGEEWWVNMVELNRNGSITVSAEGAEKTDAARDVYYLPARGRMDVPPSSVEHVLKIGTLPPCHAVSISIGKAGPHAGQLIVEVVGGVRKIQMKLADNIYGGTESRHLRSLLWPAVLLD